MANSNRATSALVVGLLWVSALAAQPASYTVYSLLGDPGDGQFSATRLVEDSAGNLWGTSAGGQQDRGAIFMINPDLTAPDTLVYSFTGGTDGAGPDSGLIQRGVFYGTTANGGVLGTPPNITPGFGVVYVYNPKATTPFATLYTFMGGADGASPSGGLLAIDSAQNLYGATFLGGTTNTTNCDQYGCGTVFMVDPKTKTKVTLYAFAGGADGMLPNGSLYLDPATGNLYGASLGGTSNNGLIYELVKPTPPNTTWIKNTVYTFPGGAMGSSPNGGLYRDSSGNLYGTTSAGGTGVPGYGVVFFISATGVETVLHTFTGFGATPPDGAYPHAGLIPNPRAKSIFFGTAVNGGNTSNDGIVYMLNVLAGPPSFGYTILHTMAGGNASPVDGAGPDASLFFHSNGNLYGATMLGGANGHGTLFTLKP